MLSFFKSNNPAVVIFYFVYLALFRVCAFYLELDYTEGTQHDEPLSHWLFSALANLRGDQQIWLLSLGGAMTFIQALFVNKMVNENKVLARKNYLAGLLFIIAVSFFRENLFLSPAMLATTFIILAVDRIFGVAKKEKANGDIFDAAFFTAIATLFYFPAILMLLFVYAALATVRTFTTKEWVIVLMGFVAPFVVTFCVYFYLDRGNAFFLNLANRRSVEWLHGLSSASTDWFSLAAILLLVLVSLIMLPAALYASVIQVRKYTTTMIFLISFCVIGFFLQQEVNQSHWSLLALPLAILFSIVLIQIKNSIVSEVLHLILILLVLIGQFFPLLSKL